MSLVKPQLLSGETISEVNKPSQNNEVEKQDQVVGIENTEIDSLTKRY